MSIFICPVCCDLDPGGCGVELCYECLRCALDLTQFFADVARWEAELPTEEQVRRFMAWARSGPR